VEPEDEALVAAGRDGDRRAVETLILRHQRLVFNVIRRMVGRTEDARDLSQTVFLKAFENLHTFDPRFKFKSWLTRIAINEALNHVQRRRVTEVLDERIPDRAAGPVDALNGADVARAIDQALRALTPDLRAVVVLRYFAELSYREMASLLALPEKTVKSRLFSSRQRLKDVLAGMGVLGN